ncbi:MAG: four helix bundle protein [Balneolaceae bacterium]
MTIERFEDLQVWKDARVLTQQVYQISNGDRFSRDFRLKDQVRGSSISIMSNIAEGFEYYSVKQFQRYLSFAKGSAGELRSQFYVAFDAKYITKEKLQSLISEAESISKQCAGFMKYLDSYDNDNYAGEPEDFLTIINYDRA